MQIKYLGMNLDDKMEMREIQVFYGNMKCN